MDNLQYYTLLQLNQNNLRTLIESYRINTEILQNINVSNSVTNPVTNPQIPSRIWRRENGINFNTTLDPFIYEFIGRINNNNNQSLTQRQINNSIIIDTYENMVNPLQISSCPITHQDFVNNSIVSKIINCNHIFNHDSLNTWLQDHQTCPVCRQNILNNNINNRRNNQERTNNEETRTNSEETRNNQERTNNEETRNNIRRYSAIYSPTNYSLSSEYTNTIDNLFNNITDNINNVD